MQGWWKNIQHVDSFVPALVQVDILREVKYLHVRDGQILHYVPS